MMMMITPRPPQEAGMDQGACPKDLGSSNHLRLLLLYILVPTVSLLGALLLLLLGLALTGRGHTWGRGSEPQHRVRTRGRGGLTCQVHVFTPVHPVIFYSFCLHLLFLFFPSTVSPLFILPLSVPPSVFLLSSTHQPSFPCFPHFFSFIPPSPVLLLEDREVEEVEEEG